MGRQRIAADAVLSHAAAEEAHNRTLLPDIQTLLVVVAKHDNSQIALVMRADMGALPGCRPRRPDASRRIDREVVSNVAKGLRPPSEMGAPNRLEPRRTGREGGVREGGHAVVVYRDAFNRSHAVHAPRDGVAFGPSSALQDTRRRMQRHIAILRFWRKRGGRFPDRAWDTAQRRTAGSCTTTEQQQCAAEKPSSSGLVRHVLRWTLPPCPNDSSAGRLLRLEYTAGIEVGDQMVGKDDSSVTLTSPQERLSEHGGGIHRSERL